MIFKTIFKTTNLALNWRIDPTPLRNSHLKLKCALHSSSTLAKQQERALIWGPTSRLLKTHLQISPKSNVSFYIRKILKKIWIDEKMIGNKGNWSETTKGNGHHCFFQIFKCEKIKFNKWLTMGFSCEDRSAKRFDANEQ